MVTLESFLHREDCATRKHCRHGAWHHPCSTAVARHHGRDAMRIAPTKPEQSWRFCPACGHDRRPYHDRDVEEVEYCSCEPKAGDVIEYDAIRDWRGNLAKPGDIVAYPYLSRRSAQISTGILKRIYAAVPKSYGSEYQTRLQVIPLDRSWWNLWSADRDTPVEDRKPSTLQYWDRFILLEERTVR